MPFKHHNATRYQNGQLSPRKEALLEEEALELRIDNQAFTITMRTPGKDLELAIGLLFTEGILEADLLPKTEITKNTQSTTINLIFPKGNNPNISKRSIMSVSSCGVCGKQDLADVGLESQEVTKRGHFPFQKIHSCFQKMSKHQTDFIKTGGAHAAAAFDFNGKLLSSMEDIGRHNAVDKVIGDLIIKNKLDEAFVLTVSGRVSFEIVSKASKANFAILAAVSAVSSLAVEYAEENQLTLLGFCRDDKATCYAHEERLIEVDEKVLSTEKNK